MGETAQEMHDTIEAVEEYMPEGQAAVSDGAWVRRATSSNPCGAAWTFLTALCPQRTAWASFHRTGSLI